MTDTNSGHSRSLPSTSSTLLIGAIGVVYGDIGTSPLYAIRECFHGLHAVDISETNILGVLSLVFWSLALIVTFKYVAIILKADNHGEGGIFALMSKLPRSHRNFPQRMQRRIALLGIFGASLLYGDGVITPAISVLSAVEGLELATPAAKNMVIPLTCIILIGLFLFQHRGTTGIGAIFGPIMLLWFFVIAVLGIRSILQFPGVLLAISPAYAIRFFFVNRLHGVVVLGSVVLCITGAEALYADLGHFNKTVIRKSWLWLVWPSLLCNYFGQGALLLRAPGMAENPFYGQAPGPMLYPLLFLATMAAIIASQAMISGVFSLSQQAIHLGLLPRLRILHTSSKTKGQIYIPFINRVLLLACLLLVLFFQSSARLAGAYGLAVTATMGITSILFFFVIRHTWKRSLWTAVPLVGIFLLFDLLYFGANLLKLADGGWITIGVASLVMVVMTAWKDGRAELSRTVLKDRVSEELFLSDITRKKPIRIPGTAVFLSVIPVGVPVAQLHHYKFNKILYERVLFLSMLTADTPHVADGEKLTIQDLGYGFVRITVQFGFMENPNVPRVFALAQKKGLEVDVQTAVYYLSRETLLTSGPSRMRRWRKNLFASFVPIGADAHDVFRSSTQSGRGDGNPYCIIDFFMFMKRHGNLQSAATSAFSSATIPI